MKAQVIYQHGWMLQIPKTGYAPMLFMMWAATQPAAVNWLHDVTYGTDYFSVRLNLEKEQYEQCAQYINDNL